MREIGDCTAEIGFGDIEMLDDGGSEKLNPQLWVQKEGPDLGRRDQVLQVGVARREIIKFAFEFGINRLQLLVSRLKLLPIGFKLLRVRAVFLVDRLQLLI